MLPICKNMLFTHTPEAKDKIKNASIKMWKEKDMTERNKKISKKMMGNKNGFGNKGIIGRKRTIESRIKQSISNRGEKASNWRGGITSENEKIRKGIEIRLWREAVFARDNWTCQKCKDNRGGNLRPHHIKNFAQCLEIRTSIENGITFCKNCHKKFHDKYGYINNTKEQVEEFIIN
jgi:hypothetical protein